MLLVFLIELDIRVQPLANKRCWKGLNHARTRASDAARTASVPAWSERQSERPIVECCPAGADRAEDQRVGHRVRRPGDAVACRARPARSGGRAAPTEA